MLSKAMFPEDTVQYELEMFKGSLCSKCELFTDEKYGYIPFYKLIDANKAYNLNDVLRICTELGFENECRQMILVDSLVFNQDRHLGNFGFIVDNETFQIVKFAPMFDFNLSMLCNAMEEDLADFEKYQEKYKLGHKLGGVFSEIGKAILSPELKACLPKTFNFPIHPLYNMESQRINRICDLFEANLQKISGSSLFRVSLGISPSYNKPRLNDNATSKDSPSVKTLSPKEFIDSVKREKSIPPKPRGGMEPI